MELLNFLSAPSPVLSLFNKGSYVKQPRGSAKVGLLFLPLLCSVVVQVCVVTAFGFMIVNCWGILFGF